MVVAESLHRGLVSKILAKKVLPNVPKEVWEGKEDPIVKHDRANCLLNEESIFYINRPFERSREELVGRVLREQPDWAGVDLSLILEVPNQGNGTVVNSGPRYHVIRIQVKGGKDPVPLERIKSFLRKANVDKARGVYARALGVGEDEIQFHRLLATLPPVAPKVRGLFAPATGAD